jgi:S-adenosylmethionine:tRNA-ribosyltransferase-isomerase (queuine synthetase)
MSDKDDDLLDSVNAMADRLKLKGKERTTYVHEHMTRSGYRAVPNYVKSEDDDDDDDGGSTFFGKRSGSGSGSGSRRSRSRRDDDDDW